MLASGFPKDSENRLTGSGPEVTSQTGNDYGGRHEVQPERSEVLRIHQVTQRQGTCMLELGVNIRIDLAVDQTFDTLAGTESTHRIGDHKSLQRAS